MNTTKATPTSRLALALAFSLPLFAFSLFSGCSRRETAVAAGLRTQTLHIGNDTEPAGLDPQTYALMADGVILSALFEGLVNLANDGTTILPGVAERWELSPDGLTYTFHLRADARWSNGDPITAEDFHASYRRFLDPQFASLNVDFAHPIAGARDFSEGKTKDFSAVGVCVSGSRMLVIKLAYRAPFFLTSLAGVNFVPVHLPSVDKFDGRQRHNGKWTLPGNLVSNGPFLLTAWHQNQVVIVTRNPRYWDAARVRLNEIRFYPNDDEAGEERAYRTGQLHVTFRLPATKLETYRTDHAPELHQTSLLHTASVVFNTTRPPFADPRVRRAFSLAIDRNRVTTAVFGTRAQPAHSLTRPGAGGFEPPAVVRHDIAEARRWLAEAGFAGGRGFPIVELRVKAGSSDYSALAEALQQMWQQTLGVQVVLLQMEKKTMVASLYAKDFQLALTDWFYGWNDPAHPMQLCEKGGPNNLTGWEDLRFEAANAEVRQASTASERLAAFATMEGILAEEAPYAPLHHANKPHLVHPTVRGWRDNALYQIDWRELWLEAGN